VLVDLGTHLVEFLRGEAEALRHVQPRLVAAAEPDDVAIGDDALVPGSERDVRVRILGELERPVRLVRGQPRCQASW
jgi:hypothetical protein